MASRLAGKNHMSGSLLRNLVEMLDYSTLIDGSPNGDTGGTFIRSGDYLKCFQSMDNTIVDCRYKGQID